MKNNYKIEDLKEYLNLKRPLPKTVLKKIYENIRADYVYNSNAIEGNTLTLKETVYILEYGMTVKGKSLKEHLEAKNQAYAIDFLMNEAKTKPILSKRLIKEFHQIIIGDIDREIAGKFRNEPIVISGSKTKTSPFQQIENDLDNLLEWYQETNDIDLIEKISIFHAKFENIHPFADGNGRTGRLIMNMELLKNGYPITIIKNEDRLDYYDALEKAQTTNDYSDIIEFIRNNVKSNIINNLEMLEENWEENFIKYMRNK